MPTKVAVFKFWEKDLISDPNDELTDRLEFQLNLFMQDIFTHNEVVKTVTHTALVKDDDIIHIYSVFFDTEA